jgi:hypothetical protein
VVGIDHAITSLEVLVLSSAGITDDGLAHLSGLKLRQLRLESPWISGAGLRHVGGMTDLWCLVLNSPRPDSLLPLGHLTELRWVGLDGTAVGDADMVILARSKGLFHLAYRIPGLETLAWPASGTSQSSNISICPALASLIRAWSHWPA